MISQGSKCQFVCKQAQSTKSQGREITRKHFPHNQICFQGAETASLVLWGDFSPSPSGY